ncbi:SIR2 family protein [Dyella choica]|uniref:Uncharacterized protein n=1 Tax=Dyella choica TaxID=1927959 RepID=A0A3S0R4Q1_9GAMM|nr:SIR2 family protein [Dyella choica]RUL77491.1 hypothetical protein EKH80_06260 [Dyella choica]
MPKKRKLLITVGAGASIDFDMPSVRDVDKLLDEHAGKEYPLAADPSTNLYRFCRDAINLYYGGSPKSKRRKWTNFEEVLYQINLLISHVSDPSRLQGFNALIMAPILPDVIDFGEVKPTDGHILRRLVNTSIDAIVDRFVDDCEKASKAKSIEIAELGKFLIALWEEFEIGIITLNYDDLISQAMPGLHTGFNITGNFDPMSVLARTDWNFLYHLHGSVHFGMTGVDHDIHGITWVDSSSKSDAIYAYGRNSQDSMEGTPYPTSTIVAGYGKPQQILRQPFRTYFAQVNRLVHEADCLLFLGYGFSDLHLNAVFSEVRDRRRPIVIVDYASDKQDALSFRYDDWSYNLTRTLRTNPGQMSRPGHLAPVSVAELRADYELEVSNDPNRPLAVWYNGMLEACRHPEKILANLR